MKHSKEELKLFQSFPLDVKMGKTALRMHYVTGSMQFQEDLQKMDFPEKITL